MTLSPRNLSGRSQELREQSFGPTAPWLAAGFLLTGLGTVLLGPLLPTLAHEWRLSDAQSGLLALAKFTGAFIGGVAVPRRLRFGVFGGALLACIGFAAFGLAGSLATGCAALFVSGVGIGQIIASTNILAGRRYRTYTGSALASLNFFWSLGAVLTGVLTAALLPRFGLRDPLLWLAFGFLAVGFVGLLRTVASSGGELSAETEHSPLPGGTLAFFALLLFLYGGLETCLTTWITTFQLRFSDLRLLGGQSGIVLLWGSLTAGRAIVSAALRVAGERVVQRAGLALSVVCIAALTVTRHGGSLSFWCVLTGLSLAPFFPCTFALLMRAQPSVRMAGLILAVSGLGAAFFPWLMGVISTHAHSLRVAMAVPWLLAVVLLLLTSISSQLSSNEAFPRRQTGEAETKTAI